MHEKTDDFGQPTGNAGGRVGCGVISPAMDAGVVDEHVDMMKKKVSPEGNVLEGDRAETK
mgnify:CR=1 FL=1